MKLSHKAEMNKARHTLVVAQPVEVAQSVQVVGVETHSFLAFFVGLRRWDKPRQGRVTGPGKIAVKRVPFGVESC